MTTEADTRPKVTIMFTEPGEAVHALRSGDYRSALWEIQQQVFRPARKHGYSDAIIASFLGESVPEAERAARHELIGRLEELYLQVLQDDGIDLDDCI